jgi:16S rRNA (cytosine1402-N4)-methyltransferase
VDANLGGGGHAQAVLERIGAAGTLIGIDLDPSARQAATERLGSFPGFQAMAGNFADLEALLDARHIAEIDGIYFDLGVSSPQLDVAERGFSFRAGGPLDMRFDPAAETSADELVNQASEAELTRIIRDYGEERWAGPIARAIVRARPIHDTAALADVVSRAIPRQHHPPKIHPATRTFQALRIAVNDELESLRRGLEAGLRRLRKGGRLVCISWHSLEDRIVKQTLQRAAGEAAAAPRGLPRGFPIERPEPQVKILTRRAVTPTEREIAENPRARSARLRAGEKLTGPGHFREEHRCAPGRRTTEEGTK